MQDSLRSRLVLLPSLQIAPSLIQPLRCKVCAGHARLFDVVDFNKICAHAGAYYPYGLSGVSVPYYRCDACQFIFTVFFDDWSQQDFAEFIYNVDYRHVDPDYVSERPTRMARWIATGLKDMKDSSILDFGSGSGLLQSLLAKEGFSKIVGYDPISNPDLPETKFDLIFAFEVIEHSPDPLWTFGQLASLMVEGGCLIVSQTLQPRNVDTIRGSWWYIAPRNGHVSTYSIRTLRDLSAKVGLLIARRLNETTYAFTKGTLSTRSKEVLSRLAIEDPRYLFVLTSPPEAEVTDSWHGVELAEKVRFRWSRARVVTWSDVFVEQGETVLRLEYLIESRDGFAKGCQLIVDGVALDLMHSNNRIESRLTSSAPMVISVQLVSPDLTIPLSFGVADDRPLGLAIPVE